MAKKVFRADHVGSFLRPAELKTARADFKAGRISAEELAAVEDRTIREVVKLQQDVGLKTITDGEFRRDSWSGDFLTAIHNVSTRPSTLSVKFHSKEGEFEHTPPGFYVDGKLELKDGIFIDHFMALKKMVAPGMTPKLSIPSPTMLHFRAGREGVSREAYPQMQDFYDDVARIYQEEIEAVAATGCELLQIDDTNWAYLCDDKLRDDVRSFLKEEPDQVARTYAKLINAAIAKRPQDMTVYMHVCRGNSGSMWVAEGGYDPVAEVLFNEMDIDGYLLEWDTDRAGDFKPLRFVPKGKIVVLGLVSSKFPELESKDDLKRRIDEAARFVPLEQLAISPQCGFSSNQKGNQISEDDQRRKLERVVEVATEVWGGV